MFRKNIHFYTQATTLQHATTHLPAKEPDISSGGG